MGTGVNNLVGHVGETIGGTVGGPVGGIIGGFIDNVIAGGRGAGNEVQRQLSSTNPPWPQDEIDTYIAWTKVNAPDIYDGGGNLWAGPGNFSDWHYAVWMPTYRTFAAQGMNNTQANTATKKALMENTVDTQTGKKLPFKFLMIWPWEQGAFKAAEWYHWLIWGGSLLVGGWLLWKLYRMMTRKRKSRKNKL